MSTTSIALNISQGQVSLRRHSDLSIEPLDELDEAFFFPDVSDAIAEDFAMEHADLDDLVDAIDLNQHDAFYDTDA